MTVAPRAAVRRLALTRVISITGGAASYTALMFTIFVETHSAAWLTLAALATFGAEGLVLFSFLSALAEPAFISASAAAIPNLVGEDLIAWANGTVSLGRNLGILVGPLIGGALVSRIRAP